MNGDCKRLIDNCGFELRQIKEWIDKNKFDTNVRFLTFYSVIKSCSTIEVVFKKIIFNYLSQNTDNKTNNELNKYLEKMIIDSSINPSTKNIEKMLYKFNRDKKKKFNTDVKNSKEKSHLDSLVQLRNDFAHGKNISVGINAVIEYFNSSKIVIEKLYNILFSIQ